MRSVEFKRLRAAVWILGLWLGALLITGCELSAPFSPTVTPTPTATVPPTATPTPTATVPPTATPTPTGTFTATPTETPTITRTPTASPTATVTPSPTQPTTAGIFARLAPSIAFVEVASGSGSGVLIEGGYVLTNAHVVWPFEHVRVVFGDQSEYLKVPVAHWDLMADLALLGPIQTALSPLALGNGEDLAVGSEVLLIGYPGEPEKLPRPTLATGILSRLREWEPVQMTFLQTDATVAGGQSGGVLISRDGEIIGITSLSFAEEQFALAISAKDIAPRLRGLLAGEDVTGLGDRRLSRKEGQTSHTVSLESPLAVQAYVVDVPAGSELKVEVESEHNASFTVVEPTGYWLAFADEGASGVESDSATTEVAGPHFVVVFREEGWGPGDFQVTSNRQLIPVHDPDDGKTINLGQTLRGSIDYPGDSDVFVIDLENGAIITMHVDSIAIDPLVGILATGSEFGELVEDDDSGGGLLGLNAELHYKATQAGTHLILVEDSFAEDVGGYVLTVKPAAPDATPVTAPTPTPIPVALDTPVGPMLVYDGIEAGFSLQYPAGWEVQPTRQGETVRFANERGGLFGITEHDLVAAGLGRMDLDDYTEAIVGVLGSIPSTKVLSAASFTTVQGLPAVDITFDIGGGFLKGRRLIYVHEERLGFSAAYIAPAAQYQELESVIIYSFCSFRVNGEDLDQEAVEQCFRDTEEANNFRNQGSDSEQMGNFEQAIIDFGKAIEFRPQDKGLYVSRAVNYWRLQDNTKALEDLERALTLDPNYSNAYNIRANVHTSAKNYEQALADVEKALELTEPRRREYVAYLDTRAHIFLNTGEYEKAKSDYDAVLERGLDYPAPFLGAGLTYAALGQTQRAIELLQQGLERAAEELHPDPQLTDLMPRAQETLSKLTS